METTTRSIAARVADFVLTYRAGHDTGLFMAFLVLCFLSTLSAWAWIVTVPVMVVLVLRGSTMARRRQQAVAARAAAKTPLYPGYPY